MEQRRLPDALLLALALVLVAAVLLLVLALHHVAVGDAAGSVRQGLVSGAAAFV